jgi:hypothetical protein
MYEIVMCMNIYKDSLIYITFANLARTNLYFSQILYKLI